MRELGSLSLWLEEVDTIYLDVVRGPWELQPLAYNLLRSWVWPYYSMSMEESWENY